MRLSKLLSLALLLAFAHGAWADLVNGTFDTDLDGWDRSGGCDLPEFRSDIGNPLGAVMLNDCGYTDPMISQLIDDFIVGNSYVVSWETYLHIAWSGTQEGSFAVLLGESIESLVPIYTGMNISEAWVGDSVEFTAAASSLVIAFAAEYTGDISYYVDNIAIAGEFGAAPPVVGTPPEVSVPEPGTLALLGLGLAGFAVTRRRRD